MLQLQHICKTYTTGTFVQTALDNVCVSFRDNEFVAILGPSGSGKTTLLNIVGGLDHYDWGDLVIDGISTQQYHDRDWDAYRNNRIGFVFQSYNLIPHQTVLANVELALTLSGVSRTERHERALEALGKVGLADHVNKKPSQLSGGQMQRVAIARALINDPEILLADEPTGALDSKTSVQIMDLLTEIAEDRLVIMVTHNPELAERYATRIVNLADGVVQSDTDPFNPATEDERTSSKPTRRTRMSFLTALSLSFKNLLTKKGRTIMTAFAGSIGIIGIASILALANGVNNYIKSVEEETLSQYPLQIQSTGFDMTSLMVNMATGGSATGDSTSTTSNNASDASATGSANTDATSTDAAQVGVHQTLTSMLSSVGSNDLASLKAYLDNGESGIEPYINAIEYTYDVTPQVFSSNTETIRQVNPDKSFSSAGLGAASNMGSMSSVMSMTTSTNTFFELPQNANLYESQYDVRAGRWPEGHNECVLVLTSDGSISDIMQYTLGLRDSAELTDMVKQYAAEEEVSTPTDVQPYRYDDIVGTTFKLVNAADLYSYDEEFGVWTNKSDNADYMRGVVDASEDLTVVGIVQPSEDAETGMLSAGIYYPAALTTYVVEQAAASPIVQDQMARPEVNVFTGKSFAEESENANSGLGLDSLFTFDGEALQAAFTINESALAVDMSNALDLAGGLSNMPAAPEPDMESIVGAVDIGSLPVDQVSALMASLMQDYATYLQEYAVTTPPLVPELDADGNPATDSGGNPVLIANPNYHPLTAQEWMATPEVQAKIAAGMQGMVDDGALEAQLSAALQSYVQTTMAAYMGAFAQELQVQMTTALQQSMNQLASNIASAMSIDPDKFQEAFKMNMTEEELGELMASLMSTEEASYDGNLAKLGYADFSKPHGIDIYPKDFASKSHVIEILDGYNELMQSEGEDDKVITYTDFVGALMSSVTEIVNMISSVLVAFVAISLVVSSIMIGVITYISVLERKKEIGILRSIGASKRDIGRVFNAETVIVGFVAGALGIGITALFCIPVNAIVYALFHVTNVAALPWQAAVVLIGISVLLTFLAGLIPASAASRKDPVEALRSE